VSLSDYAAYTSGENWRRALLMIVVRYAAGVPRDGRPRIAAGGVFDGVHLGHRKVLDALRDCAARARGQAVVVLSRHIGVAGAAPRLASLRRTVALLAEWDVDVALWRRGDERDPFRNLEVQAVVGGPSGAAVDGGHEAHSVSVVECDGEPICAARIREAVMRADFTAADRMLGRPYAIDGRIVHGFHRGGPLGVPTANLRIGGQLLPPDGVYAVVARVGGRPFRGVANIGCKPTFGDHERSVETHLFDFGGDIYGHLLEVSFVERLRPERKFDGVDALLEQIHRDIAAAKKIHARQ
jgi:riboflavin kinase/FMN adenylyltransferase